MAIDYIFGANILENLTTGMYPDSRVIYREYIQNACDAIDQAIEEGVLNPGEGSIAIWQNKDDRTVSIEDDGIGIKAKDFVRVLGNIADSDKKVGEDKGFRGIGRLCGLAYCETLVFTTSFKGENTISVMTCDAKLMRAMLDENVRGIKHEAKTVLNAINSFDSRVTDDADSHFFKVELIDINKENRDLLDLPLVKDYLSFVAPVQYQNQFIYRREVSSYAVELGVPIDVYSISLNGETILKHYTADLRDSSGNKDDEVFDIEFRVFNDSENRLLAWLWFGLTQFRKQIVKSTNPMRSIRLRKDNIQIGGEDTLQKLFKEDRGNSYFIGEVFAVSESLVPNSQRDYFNESPVRLEFEEKLKEFFNDELYQLYYAGSKINSQYKKVAAYNTKSNEYQKKHREGAFVDSQHREKEMQELNDAHEKARKAKEVILRSVATPKSETIGKVFERIEKQQSILEIEEESHQEQQGGPSEPRLAQPRRVDRLSRYSKQDRKLISRIYSVIASNLDSVTAEELIEKIEEELS